MLFIPLLSQFMRKGTALVSYHENWIWRFVDCQTKPLRLNYPNYRAIYWNYFSLFFHFVRTVLKGMKKKLQQHEVSKPVSKISAKILLYTDLVTHHLTLSSIKFKKDPKPRSLLADYISLQGLTIKYCTCKSEFPIPLECYFCMCLSLGHGFKNWVWVNSLSHGHSLKISIFCKSY